MPRGTTPRLAEFSETIEPNRITCPECLGHKHIIKAGIRKTKSRGKVQRYQCTDCRKLFSLNALPSAKYPPKIIAYAITYYNTGYSLEQTRDKLKRTYKTSVPLPTIHAWLSRHAKLCTFAPLRKRYDINPKTIIRRKKLYHQQVFEFAYHDLKLNIAAKTYPGLRYYLRSIWDENTRRKPKNRSTTKIFTSSTTRCSTFKPPKPPEPTSIKTIKTNNAVKMAGLALTLAKNRSMRHEKIEDFFLTNDSSTTAIEIPVYLLPKEAPDLELPEPLTGHIDLLQYRNRQVQILDYKPDQNPQRAFTQLYLYKRALSRRTSIPMHQIQTAAFNEKGFVEFKG